MMNNHVPDCRMCTSLLTLAATAIFACSAAAAQSGGMNTQPQQPNNGSMNTQSGPMGTTPMSGNGMGQMGSNGSNGSMGSMQDKTFAKKALAGGMAEVQLGQLAAQKGNSEDVKQFGQKMVDDHTKLNDQMKPIAATLGVQPPAELTQKDQKLMTRLQALSGDDFDKAYIKAMLKDHKEDDKEFQMEASTGQNAQEKDAAMQGDQVIKQHLQLVEQLARTHNVMGGNKASM